MVDKRRHDTAFKDAEEEYAFHLIRSEYHLHRAVELANRTTGPKRSLVCKTLLRRAHGIVTGLYTQEVQRKKST